LREVLARHGIRPDKAMGQNFVVDPNTIRKMIAVSEVGPGSHVLEIGAGAGSLTIGLADACAGVTAVEFDRRLIPALTEVVAERPNVRIVEADALVLGYEDVAADQLVANLPYNIATPVVMRILETATGIRRLTVMTQREVGERFVASPMTKAYGAPTVLAAYFSRARILSRVSRNAFWPVPGVDSVIVGFDRRDSSPTIPYPVLQRIVRAAFSQRRKTLRNTLGEVFGSATAAEAALTSVGIDPAARAEELTLDDFVRAAGPLQED
jgi:16S rRNA (adenine1518-N6/adenine1519-N6)-dimethyltransferase